MASTAQTGDFLGSGGGFVSPSAMPAVKAPKRTASQLARDKAVTATRAREDLRKAAAATANRNAGYNAQRAADAKQQRDFEQRMRTEDSPEAEAWRAREKFISSARTDWGLLPMGAKIVGTAVGVIATGGALAGALGATAALSTAASATTVAQLVNTTQQGIRAVNTGAKVASAVKSGNVKQATSAVLKGGGDVASLGSKLGVKLSTEDLKKIKTGGAVPKVASAAVKKATTTAKAVKATVAPKVKVAATASAAIKKAAAKPAAAVKSAATKSGNSLTAALVKAGGSAMMGKDGVLRPSGVGAAAALLVKKASVAVKPGTMKSLTSSLKASVSSVVKTTAQAAKLVTPAKAKPAATVAKKASASAAAATPASAVKKAVSAGATKPATASGALAAKATTPANTNASPVDQSGEEGYFIATAGPNRGKIIRRRAAA